MISVCVCVCVCVCSWSSTDDTMMRCGRVARASVESSRVVFWQRGDEEFTGARLATDVDINTRSSKLRSNAVSQQLSDHPTTPSHTS
jgi:hypothetical protein